MNSELKNSAYRIFLSWGILGVILILFVSCRPATTWISTVFALATIAVSYGYYLHSAYRAHYVDEHNAVMLVYLFALVSLAYILFFAGYFYAFRLFDQDGFATALYLSTGAFTGLGIGDAQVSTPHHQVLVIAEAILGTTHMVSFIALFLTKFISPQPQTSGSSEEPQNEQAFEQKKTKPTASEYLYASETELLERLNNNPGGRNSEFPFIQSVIAVRTAESHRKANESLVRQTKLLVIPTWAICAATVIATIWAKSCGS